ncbi:nuclear transport factor 2 family protein [Sulfuriferula sp. AH1]|uniref:nuclear transport factor 2 family protein n=1 Tax=Sulfuriferula sp. AH1 TaxID=1985873 RepID=UPI0012F83EA8|nr:nuclear transport factor 2 family protein [Sulfuriferula sp. AH1]
MKKYVSLLAILAVALSSTATFAAQPGGVQVSIPTVTRLVKIFSGLECDLDQHIRKGDGGTIDTLLADDFEMRVGAMPGNPIPRAQWLDRYRSDNRGTAACDIRQMAVHDYDVVAVVSFLLKQDKAKKASGDIYMVDVWKKSGEGWKLAVRYASPAGSAHFLIPGAATDAPHIDKRY